VRPLASGAYLDEISWLARFRSSVLLKNSSTYVGFTVLNVLIALLSMSA
jgi:hypothetical protein